MATTLAIKDATGADTGKTFDIQENWLALDKKDKKNRGEQAAKDSVVAFLAGLRAGTASTKTKGLVAGGGGKPWRQKGTGRARSGSSRSPVWRGGGVAFGPQPRSYAKKINQKVEKLALRRIFTDKLKQDEIILVDAIPDMRDADSKAPKTKKMVEFLKALGLSGNILILDANLDTAAELASRNLPTVLAMKALSVNPYLMMRFDKIVITSAGLEILGERLA